MHQREQRPWARVVGIILGTVLLVMLGATTATAGSGKDVVAFDPDDPNRIGESIEWAPRTGETLTAPHADLLSLTLPDELVDEFPMDMSFVVRGATSYSSAFGVTDSRPVVDSTISFDVDDAIQQVTTGLSEVPTMLLVVAVPDDPTPLGDGGYLQLEMWITLEAGSTPTYDIALDYPQDPAASGVYLTYETEAASAGYGTTLVVQAAPGFWSASVTVEVEHVPGDPGAQFQATTVSRDGSTLTFTLPERWDPSLGDIGQVRLYDNPSPTHWKTIDIPILQASKDPVAAYVTSVYEDLFGRGPDPTGLSGWTRALRSGTPYGAVADGITYSREFRAGLVTDAYWQYLGRGPDPAGLTSWVDAMDAGLHIQKMEAGFLASAEYYASAGGTDLDWIAAVYVDVLGRAPGPSEVRGWVPVVRGVGRVEAARQFLYSTEHLTTVVNGYYEWLLGRGIDPTGQRGWVQAIQAGTRSEAIVSGIIASNEYRGRVPVSS